MKIAKLALVLSIIAILGYAAPLLHENFMYGHIGQAVVKLTGGRSGGTGSVVSGANGKVYTLTNAHICKLADEDNQLKYETQDGRSGYITVIEILDEHDLCILERIWGIRPLSVAGNSSLHEKIYLIGHPALRPLTLQKGNIIARLTINVMTNACSIGELNARILKVQLEIKELLKQEPTPHSIYRIMQLTKELISLQAGFCVKSYEADHINAISYGGNSGSPVVNKFGQIVGVLFAGRRDQNTASYMVPLPEVQKFLFKHRDTNTISERK